MEISSKERDFERCPQCGARVDLTDPRQVAHHMAPDHDAVIAPAPGMDRGGLIEGNDHAEELGYFDTCRACCQTYDTRDSAEVLHHATPGHKPLLPVS